MCNYLLPITPDYDNRSIYRCEHGTFHLAWGRATFHLSPEELNTLYALAHGLATDDNINRRIHLHQRTAPSGEAFIEIWLAGFGFRLTLPDFRVLQAILQNAMDWLSEQPPFSESDHMLQIEAAHIWRKNVIPKKLFWN
ncbi:MAG: hypothetical protein N2117_04700 [Anaerolineales bacterium]|nr:hypothetical protein [Anaerolineales bacterium]MCX7754528.1 hypothetical protein [Anaerolineales bacterium]MDW8277229.1 hypothetical protein [Anaerolineales bacterium]